jgi:hypothetical protein
MGAPAAQQMVRTVFGAPFQTPQGWADFLDHNIPARDVEILLKRTPGFWHRENFQALYVACWIFHPVEKGSYMLQLGSHHANVRDAYLRMVKSGELQPRISSHLSKTGASAHEGWDFLQGYGELLIQIEGGTGPGSYLFLKCEGHPPRISARLSRKSRNSLGCPARKSPWAKSSMACGRNAAFETRCRLRSHQTHIPLGRPCRDRRALSLFSKSRQTS